MTGIRIGYMAGRGVSIPHIAEKMGCSAVTIRNALREAGIEIDDVRGATCHVIVPIESFIEAIDAVGRKRRMSRDQIGCEILRIVFSAGFDGIEDVLDRAGAR